MKHVLLAAAAAVVLGFGAPALAATPANPQSSPTAKAQAGAVELAQRGPDRSQDRGRHDAGDRDRYRDPHAWQQRYPNARGGHPHWSRGDRLYRDYRAPDYYVNDWQRYHLRRPPHGYRWVRVDDQYLLVAITTGIIMDAILMNMMQNQ